jgi:hypothetical protein
MEGMSERDPRETMGPEERHAFCREVLENLSGLVEGDAPEELCRQVEETLGDCGPYLAFRQSFELTIESVRDLGDRPVSAFDETVYARCVERARRALERGDD